MVDSGQLGTVAATNLAREVRQSGSGAADVGRRPGRGVNDTWFGPRHRLAMLARRRCEVAEHDDIKVGHVACGPCWEAVIVADATEAVPGHNVETITVRDGLL